MIDILIYVILIGITLGISILFGKILGPIFIRIIETLTKKTKSTLDDKILEAIKTPFETFFFIIVFYFLIHQFPELLSVALFVEKYTLAIIIIFLAYIISESIGAIIRWYYEEGSKKPTTIKFDLTLLPLLRKVSKLLIYTFGAIAALSTTGIDVTGIFTITSVVVLVLGLASQETLANIFAGIALQIDRPFRYGDYLRLPVTNEIVILRKIGMRSTKLEDLHNNLIIISNSEFAKLRITNLSLPNDLVLMQLKVDLPIDVDIKKLEEFIEKTLEKKDIPGLIKEMRYRITIDSIKNNIITLTFWYWIKGYQNDIEIRHEINKTILELLEKHKKN